MEHLAKLGMLRNVWQSEIESASLWLLGFSSWDDVHEEPSQQAFSLNEPTSEDTVRGER